MLVVLTKINRLVADVARIDVIVSGGVWVDYIEYVAVSSKYNFPSAKKSVNNRFYACTTEWV